jgi:hypothetical protein
MEHSPVTAHVVIVYQQKDETSTAFLEDVFGRQRELFTCPHGQVVAKIAAWSKLHDFDQCEIHCQGIVAGPTTMNHFQPNDPHWN